MLDFLLGALIVGLAIRGWWRGLLREAIALAVVVVGIFIAFRLSSPAGDVIESLAGVSPEVGRLVAGVVIYLAISVGAAVASAILHKGLRFVPGLPTLNRAAGAGFAAIAVVALATIVLSLLAIVSPPQAVANQIEESSLAGYLTDPDHLPQKAMGIMSGDRSLEKLLNLHEEAGARRVVAGDGSVLLAPTPADALDVADDATASDLVDMVNRRRDAAGAAPLVESAALTRLAREHARFVYESGRFGEEGAGGSTLDERLTASDIPVVRADEVIALALSAEAAQMALLDDAGSRSVLAPGFRRIGVAVVEGPLGVLVVEVLAG